MEHKSKYHTNMNVLYVYVCVSVCVEGNFMENFYCIFNLMAYLHLKASEKFVLGIVY